MSAIAALQLLSRVLSYEYCNDAGMFLTVLQNGVDTSVRPRVPPGHDVRAAPSVIIARSDA